MTQGLTEKNLVRGAKQNLNETWVRPADWLAMPTITPGEQKYVMLCAVWNGPSNYIRFDPAGTAYTVDWGDGSAPENIGSGTAASHNFSWAGCSAGTLTSLGYRQALVVVTPQGAGVFSGFDGFNKHASAGSGSSSPILDFEFSAPNGTLPRLCWSAVTQVHNYCQHFKAWSSVMSGGWSYHFSGMTAVRSVEGLDLSTPTGTIQGMFGGCASLIHAPAMNTASVATWIQTFNNCSRLVDAPAYDYSSASDITGMFNACSALRTVGAMNTGSCTNFYQLFQNCAALTSVPSIDTTKATNLGYLYSGCKSMVTFPTMNTPANSITSMMFNGCTSMVTAPTMDISKVTDASTMFGGCISLTTVPSYTTTALLNSASMFNGCTALRTVPLFDTSKVTTVQSMFLGCGALQSVPAFDLASCTNSTSMFANCLSLPTITTLVNTSAIVTATTMFSGCTALQTLSINLSGATVVTNLFSSVTTLRSVVLTGLRFGFTVASNLLEATALDALYTSLGTASGSQTVTVTSNPGTATDTPTIATAKGWTVAGS